MTKAYPEHERLSLVSGESAKVGAFLEWLAGGCLDEVVGGDYGPVELMHLPLMENGDRSSRPAPLGLSVERILAAYFGINLAELEKEKRAMLAAIPQETEDEDKDPS